MDVAIRLQVFHEEAWTSLLVRKELRPTTPEEERQELERQRHDRERQRLETDRARWRAILGEARGPVTYNRQDADAATRSTGSAHETSVARQAFFFDDTPPPCFEASGYYRVERTGVLFSFSLPSYIGFVISGDAVNRFLIERANLDESHGRLYFTRDGCRFELTFSQSVRRHGQWVALPLAPTQLPKG
jgi:hypothetical protein